MTPVERTEFEALKSEVAELRALVGRFLRSSEGAQNGPGIVTCTRLVLQEADGRIRGSLGVDEKGPYFFLRGNDQAARLILRVSEDAGQVRIFGGDFNPTVELWTDREGHGNIAVHSPGGVPRVGIRGIQEGGVVTVVGPSGAPRAVMHSTHDKGEVALFNDTHLLAKMSTTDQGSTLDLLDSRGGRACMILAADKGNRLLLDSPDHAGGITLTTGDHGASLCVGGKEADAAVSLTALPGQGGGIRINNCEGERAMELEAMESGGSFHLFSYEGEALIRMSILDGAGSLSIGHVEGNASVHLMAGQQGGSVMATGRDEQSAIMQVVDDATSFMVMKAYHVQAILGTSGESDLASLALTNSDYSSCVNLIAGPAGGAVLIGGSDGTTQVTLGASDEGGRVMVFSELGIERGMLAAKADGGAFKLKWGGTDGLFAMATESGGCIFVNDRDGRTIDTIPGTDEPLR